MNRFFIIVFLAVVSFGCRTQPAQVQLPEEEVVNKPYWLRQRPVEQSYYIGIGASLKHGQETEYAQMAKKQALSDLASEIRVQLSSNSMLYQLDKGESFKEEYMSSVRTSTQEELEGYEMVGSWENEREYWVYYKLSKAYWKEIQLKKKQQAIARAEDSFKRALDYESHGQVRQALSAYFKSLESLKDYYAEAVEVEVHGKNVLILNEAFDAVRRILGHIELRPQQNELSLKRGVSKPGYMDFTAVYRDPKTGELLPFRLLPVTISYKQAGIQEDVITDQKGHGAFQVKMTGSSNRQAIDLKADFKTLVRNESAERFVRKMAETVMPASSQVIIHVESPKVYLSAREMNLGHSVGHLPVSATLKTLLIDQGYVFTDDPGEAELLLQVKAQTRKGGASAEFQSSYLDLEITVIDAARGVTLYSEAMHDIKGVHLSYEQAGMVAYKKSGEVIRKKVLPEMIAKIQ